MMSYFALLLSTTELKSEINENYGLGTTIWSPLASGVLTGKYNEGIPSDSRLNLPDYEWLKDLWTSEDGKQKLEKELQILKL